jgi:amidohydrolase
MAEAHGAQAELDYRKGYPASINDAGLVKQTLGTLEKVLGSKNVVEVQPSMGGEDFAYFAQKIPGFYLSLGVTRPGTEKPARPPHARVRG